MKNHPSESEGWFTFAGNVRFLYPVVLQGGWFWFFLFPLDGPYLIVAITRIRAATVKLRLLV